MYVYDGDGRGLCAPEQRSGERGRGCCTPEQRSGERGSMVKSIINGIMTYYPGRHYNLSMDGETESIQKSYAFGSLTIATRKDGALKWVLVDHLGSTSITANADGSFFSELRYSAFGEIRYSSGTTPTDYRYTNQLSQESTGLYYYVARYYDPELARFIQADTIVPGAGSPAAYDRYAYVLNDPIMMNDPSGNAHCDENGFCFLKIGEQLPFKNQQLQVITPIFTNTTNSYIRFSSDGTLEWSDDEIKIVNKQADQLARTMAMTINQEMGGQLTPQAAWNRVFGNVPINFIRTGQRHSTGAIGWTDELTVTFYQCWECTSSSTSYLLTAKGHENIVTHELAHALINATGYLLNIPNKLLRPIENGVINYGSNRENGFYGYAGDYQSRQFAFGGSPEDEEFADMLIGWSFTSWNTSISGKEMGEKRADEMQKIMIDILTP